MKRFFIFCFFIFPVFLFSFETPVRGLFNYKLDNGLDVYILENSSVPLVYIEVLIKGGGFGQSEENAGLFHLYEHMMFKGNELYPDSSKVQDAIASLGVPSWNGSTSSDYVNYYFTVPSGELEAGLRFWSSALRSPLLLPGEFENEKKVVVSEIADKAADPSTVLAYGINSLLFPDYPWRLDPAGSVENIMNADIGDLRAIKDEFYVPSNCALFIGGDVDKEEALSLVKEIYGDWEGECTYWDIMTEYQNPVPFDSPQFYYFKSPGVSDSYASVNIYFRGPDTVSDLESTYGADVWSSLINDLNSTFIRNVFNYPSVDFLSENSIGGGYLTKPDSSYITFYAGLKNPDKQLARRTVNFTESLLYTEIPLMAGQKDYFPSKQIDSVCKSVENQRIISTDTTEAFFNEFRFWWANTSPRYYFDYQKNLESVTQSDIQAFVKKYLENRSPLVVLVLSPASYEANREDLESFGFKEITAENAFWYNKSR